MKKTTKRKRIVRASSASKRKADDDAQAVPAKRKVGRPATRAGKVGVQMWVDPSIRKRLKLYGVQTERTLDDLLTEAINDFLRKHKIS